MVQLDLSVLRLTCAGMVAAVLFGCALKTPPTTAEVVEQALPKATTIPPAWRADPRGGAVTDDWLKSLDDPMLAAIVAEAIANNLDLRAAADNVTIAQQTVIVVGAQLLPQVGAVLGARTTRDDGKDDPYNASLAKAGVAWEIDVWGRLRAQRAVAEASAEAVVLDYAWARQSLAATTAKLWYLAIEARQLLALAEQAVDVYNELLALVQIRRNAGKDSNLDVVDVSAKLETARGEVEQTRAAYGDVRRALEVVLGRYPAAQIEIASGYAALTAPPAGGIPGALLERRPDVIAAERVVLAAFRNEEAARLALLPSFSLALVGGRFGDPLLSVLRLNPWLVSAAIGASIPIYEGGALRAQIEIATAQQAQAVARYGSVVLRAFREVETTLANEQWLARRIPFDQKAFADRTSAVQIATVQYKAGRRDLLWVSNLQTAQIGSEAALIKARAAQRINRVQLLLALGGDF
jgi:NodT family efflux transporter outer membrane factor (OMF) lipoprotein